MLTGELPYDVETPGAIVMEHVGGLSRSPKVANPQVSDELDAVTVRLLSKDPDDRHADAPALVEDLGRVEAGLTPVAETMRAGITRAAETVDSGAATALLERWVASAQAARAADTA